ncbi:hypothetical protein F4804DRAFT_324712 [Jackrogersella minutella]|nr:hypothetical protein F4804DRAFT_324712 [Jackrogersella minutella]
MPRPVETLDIALPTDHPLKRPVSNRNKQTAQRIYQLWNIWPWKLFHADSPHLPTIWTDNLLDKLKTIALCTTLQHARNLLNANVPDGQPLSLAVLNAVIDECKDESVTPPNPAVKNRKRKHRRATADRYGLGELEDERESSQGLDEDDEGDDVSIYEYENGQQDLRENPPGRQRRAYPSPSRRLRGRSVAPGPMALPLSKRQKRRHHSTSVTLPFAYVAPMESTPTPTPPSASHGSSPQLSRQLRLGFEDARQSLPSSDGVATYVESVIVQLSGLFQDQRHACERVVEGTRSQLRTVESRLVSLQNELGAVDKGIVALESQKSEMEITRADLLTIEKEEEELATRRRQLMTRRTSTNWRPSSSLSSTDGQAQSQPSPRQHRASDDVQSEIDALVADQLQPSKERRAALKIDVTNTKAEIEAIRAKIGTLATELNSKSDELIRWRGFSSDVQDALIRRGFAEPAFMWEFSQKDADRRDHSSARTAPSINLPRAATTVISRSGSPFNIHNHESRAAAVEPGTAPLPGLSNMANFSRFTNQRERGRRHGSI